MALNEPRKAILTEFTAKKLFGNEDPIGKILRLDNKADVEVAAIIRDIPATSHLPFSMIVSFSTLTKEFIGGLDIDAWGVRSHGYCYARVNDNENGSTEKALYTLVQRNAETDKEKKEKMYLQPLKSIHFDPDFSNTNPSYTIGPKYLSMLLLLGFFIILVACINYINLSTSLAFSKSKEVGIRKTIGASRRQLFFHYLSETLLLTIAAGILAVGLTYALLPAVSPSNIKQTLAGIETAWKKIYPESVYEFKFIDETLAKRYGQETRDYNLFKVFSAISIFICCIGLWGLIAFVVVRKTKEIGIRKVLGSSVRGIVYLLSKDFLKLVVIALVIASPIAWYFMNRWLQDFAYRVNISWWVFAVAGIAALFIAMLTVSFQAIKAAISNPVKSLRTE